MLIDQQCQQRKVKVLKHVTPGLLQEQAHPLHTHLYCAGVSSSTSYIFPRPMYICIL